MNTTHSFTFPATALLLAMVMTLAVAPLGCDQKAEPKAGDHGHEHAAEPGSAMKPAEQAPTNRVDIPASVRQNLGITFAKVEYRQVAQTLRVPGRFEYLPTARREYRTPFAGRVEPLVAQYQRVEPGTPLYRVDAAAWRDLHEQIAAMQAQVDSMTPLREAHRRHEQSLADKVSLWQDRLKQLEELRLAGGGSASQFTEARATLNATQADLADVMEKDASLHAQQKQSEAELRSLQSRLATLVRGSHCDARVEQLPAGDDAELGYTVCAVAAGVVESIGITPGGLAEENGHIVTVVQPEQIRFRASGLQSDLGRLRDGLASRIAPPQGGGGGGGGVGGCRCKTP